MAQSSEPKIEIRNCANNVFIQQEGRDYACFSTIIDRSNALSLKMSFDINPMEAALISRALKNVNYHMGNNSNGAFDVHLQGTENITTGLKALFKRMTDGSIGQTLGTGARPLVSPAMQDRIVENIGGLMISSTMARSQLDEYQNAPTEIPVYD